ncbi:TlpA family protein disulfide reductase [Limnoglobus roseus]|uniref:TlpA family protein disulfide reductase n=1 Tax=Limnoglobus roseus TaxID=2598579 RepID=A0A5C1ADN5_9BACT|nr:TlpA disulfide reductase family protein [Limnoglobus roseus]QEL16820.1 TlpA family protein disulfide reductase [Limnoglobus roseus]
MARGSFFLTLLVVALKPGGVGAVDPLTIGSPAPELKVNTWVKGDPVAGIEKGKVYVVEFWGTACAPCIKCMPHLSELQRRYKGVVFACLCDEKEKGVRDFVAKHDKDMGFRVGWDERGRMWAAWMVAAGLEGIPTAFIVDATGKVAWIGNPTEMGEPLRLILEGKYNPQAAVIALRLRHARKEAFRKENERLDRGNRLAVQVEQLILQKKASEAVTLVDEAIQKEPGERVRYGQMKLQALVADPKLADRALEYGIELTAAAAARANEDRPTSQVLLHIASLLSAPLGGAPSDTRCCDLAIEIIKCARDVARQEKDSGEQYQFELRVHADAQLAHAYAGKGAYDKAVTHAESALKAFRTASPLPWANDKLFQQNMEACAKELEASLEEFKLKAGMVPRR